MKIVVIAAVTVIVAVSAAAARAMPLRTAAFCTKPERWGNWRIIPFCTG
jgi:hypothetical protein